MATAVAKTEVVGVALALTLEEAAALSGYLGILSRDAAQFRLDNRELYDIEDALEGAQA